MNDSAAEYTPGISESRSSTSKFYHTDRMGTTTKITNSSMSTTDSRQFDAFGMLVSSSGTTPTPFGYVGALRYQEDTDTGLKMLGHRLYDPSIGRLLTRDPIKDGRNWYDYCRSDPLRAVDPSGLWWLGLSVGVIGVIGLPLPIPHTGVGGSIEVGLGVDGNGNMGLFGYFGGGPGCGDLWSGEVGVAGGNDNFGSESSLFGGHVGGTLAGGGDAGIGIGATAHAVLHLQARTRSRQRAMTAAQVWTFSEEMDGGSGGGHRTPGALSCFTFTRHSNLSGRAHTTRRYANNPMVGSPIRFDRSSPLGRATGSITVSPARHDDRAHERPELAGRCARDPREGTEEA